MALRTIRVQGDSVLTKKSRTVDKMTPRIGELITDMLDTMYDAMGVGLAAPQVGILKRIVVIDVGEGPIVLINPEILETSGEQTGDEGCLSVPGMAGQVMKQRSRKSVRPVVRLILEDLRQEPSRLREFWKKNFRKPGYFGWILIPQGPRTAMKKFWHLLQGMRQIFWWEPR